MTAAMITVPKFDVLIAHPDHPMDPDQATERLVPVLHPDQVVAESRAARYGIPSEGAAFHTMGLWVWCSLMRQGLVDGQDFPEFSARILVVEKHEEPALVEGADVPPTPPGPGTMPPPGVPVTSPVSPSASGSATSTT